MSTELLVDLLAEIGITETPAGVMNAVESNVAVDEEKMNEFYNDYRESLETRNISSHWNESLNNSLDEIDGAVAENADLIHQAPVDLVLEEEEVMVMDNIVRPPSSHAEYDVASDHENQEEMIRMRQKQMLGPIQRYRWLRRSVDSPFSDSPSSGYESDSSSSTGTTLLSAMNLEVRLPNGVPIMPLSQMRNIMYPDYVQKPKQKTESPLISVYELNKDKFPQSNENYAKTKIMYQGRDILNLGVHLSPYVTVWNTISECKIPDYPAKESMFVNKCESCGFGDMYRTLYDTSNKSDNGCGQIDYAKITSTKLNVDARAPKCEKSIW